MELTKNWPRGARIALRVFLALLLLMIVLMLVRMASVRRDVARSVAVHQGMMQRVESQLPVLDQDELNASDVLNAACYLLRLAAKEEPRDKVSRESLRLDQEAVDEDLLRRARDWLASPHHRLVLDLIDLDADVARARFRESRDISWVAVGSEGYADLRSSVLRLVHLLRTRAFLAVHSGEIENAYRDVEIVLRIADWLRMEQPGIVPWLFRNSVVDTGTLALEELRQVAPATAEQRGRLRKILDRLEKHGKAWGLEGERAFTYSLLWRDGPPSAVLYSFDRHSYDLYERLIELSHIPPHRRPPLESIFANPPLGAAGPQFMMTNFFDSVSKTDVAALRIELAALSLAWDDYHDRQGSYPREPDALVPDFVGALPLDPWSGEDLRWRADEAGCVLYSFGVNRRDDGAVYVPRSEAEDDTAEDDIAWRLPCDPPPA